MGDMTCSNPNSCHPFLLVFGLITVFLMIIYLLCDTIFDNARPKRGPILSIYNPARPIQQPVTENPFRDPAEARFSDGGADGFRALKYEDTGVRKAKDIGIANGAERRPEASKKMAPSANKSRESATRDQADIGVQRLDFATASPSHHNQWPGRSEDPTFQTWKPRNLDLDYRPADFAGSPAAYPAEVNPYTWNPNAAHLERPDGARIF